MNKIYLLTGQHDEGVQNVLSCMAENPIDALRQMEWYPFWGKPLEEGEAMRAEHENREPREITEADYIQRMTEFYNLDGNHEPWNEGNYVDGDSTKQWVLFEIDPTDGKVLRTYPKYAMEDQKESDEIRRTYFPEHAKGASQGA